MKQNQDINFFDYYTTDYLLSSNVGNHVTWIKKKTILFAE